jgi:predicted MPP superfamily phosphohydrolase
MLSMILFSLVASAISGGIHYYVWRRLVRNTGLGRKPTRRLAIVFVTFFVSIPASMWLVRLGAPTLGYSLGWIAFFWMALVGLSAIALAAIDLARIPLALARRMALKPDAPDPARRAALARITGGVSLAAASGQIAYGATQALALPEIVDVEIELPTLPASFDGFSIVQITDLHIGFTIGRAFVERVAAAARGARPDLIAITGDMVDGSVRDLADAAAPLGELRAPHGVFAVTGNHEYYSGADEWNAHFQSLGMTVLRNQRVEIVRGERGFDLAGIDDLTGRRFSGHGADLAKALRGRNPDRPLILMAHQPKQVHDAALHGVDFQMSGHTHGGQVWPWHYLVSLQQGGLVAGRYQVGATQLYVSRGCGYWGPPVRVLAPSEIPRFVLRRR